MSIEIGTVAMCQHYIEYKGLNDFKFGFKYRLVAYDYPDFQLISNQVTILELLEQILYKYRNKYNFVRVLESKTFIPEKLTQLILQCDLILKKLDIIEKELDENKDNEFNLTEDYHLLINETENILFKLSSILDILSKISKEIYKITDNNTGVPNKYGKQKAFDTINQEFKNSFDPNYQEFLLKNNQTINLCHEYRNIFSHEKSLRLLPNKIEGKWIIIISKENGWGLKLHETIIEIMKELKDFIDHFDKYFSNKLENKLR